MTWAGSGWPWTWWSVSGPRFQFIWWGWPPSQWFRFWFGEYENAMFSVYRWALRLGPLEVRRWVTQAETQERIAEVNRRRAAGLEP